VAKDKSILPLYMQERQAKCIVLNKGCKAFGRVITTPLWDGRYELNISGLTEAELKAMLNSFKSLRRFSKVELDVPYLDIDGQPIK
jgi:hypothetical protein